MKSALLVVGKNRLDTDDLIIQARLERLGFTVIPCEDSVADAVDTTALSLVVFSSVVGPPNLSNGFSDVPVPALILGDSLYEYMGMSRPDGHGDAAARNCGVEGGNSEVEVLGKAHSMTAGLKGVVSVAGKECKMVWARPLPSAIRIAALAPRRASVTNGKPDEEAEKENRGRRRRAVVFGYERGADLCACKAAARRVGMFFERESAALLNQHGWALFDAAVEWAVGDELKQFPQVVSEEWQEIKERRERQRIELMARTQAGDAHLAEGRPHGGSGVPPALADEEEAEEEYAPQSLTGLALSGGGIRSATFCLGLLQGMHELGVLRIFDYLSTVSGGGYLGAWWSAWLSRFGQYSQARGGFPQFALYDIQQPSRLARVFLLEEQQEKSDARRRVSAKVRKFFARALPDFLKPFATRTHLETSDQKVFVNLLNNLLTDSDLFDDETLRLMRAEKMWSDDGAEGGPESDESYTVKRNRLLFERVYGEEIKKGIFPRREKIEPERSRDYFATAGGGAQDWLGDKKAVEEHAERAKDIMCAGDDPVHHLRLFANYLTPRRGLFSADTWRAITTVVRNLTLTWLTLIPLLIAFVLAGQLYFAARPESESVKQIIDGVNGEMWRLEGQSRVEGDVEFADRLDSFIMKETMPYVHDFVYGYSSLISRWEAAAQQLQADAKSNEAEAQRMRDDANSDEAKAQRLQADADGGETEALLLQADAKSDEAEGKSREANAAARLARTITIAESDGSGGWLERLRAARDVALVDRLWWAFYPLAMLLSLIVAMTSAWMVNNTSVLKGTSKLLGWVGGVAFWVLIACWLAAFVPQNRGVIAPFALPADIAKFLTDWPDTNWAHYPTMSRVRDKWDVYLFFTLVWAGSVLALVGWAWRKRHSGDDGQLIDDDQEAKQQWRREAQRNRTTRIHTLLLACLAFLSCVFLLSGFSHELAGYLYANRQDYVARAGGGLAVLATIVGAIFTAIKASPIGGGDEKETKRPSLPSRIVFALTPPLVLIVLAVLIASLAHAVFCYIVSEYETRIPPLAFATFVSALFCIMLAVSEINWQKANPRKWLSVAAICILALGCAIYYIEKNRLTPGLRLFVPLASAALSLCFLLPRLAVDVVGGREGAQQRCFKVTLFKRLRRKREVTWSKLLAACGGLYAATVAIGALLIWLSPAVRAALWDGPVVPRSGAMRALAATSMLLVCVVFVVVEIVRGLGSNRRSLWLLGAVTATMLTMLLFSLYGTGNEAQLNPPSLTFIGSTHVMFAYAVVCLLTLSLGLVIALGWLADPNSLSMHGFYKERLVRAYLGASNVTRREELRDITETVEGDDVLLRELKNCQRGAPYHLINTTLNLAAGRDITTVQRSSAMFVLSKHSCGSARTGFRGTERYMSGRLSLGTAIATSGAAASPNMGSRTPSSSLAMLMTLLNVRLGYWTPTPNKDHWQSRQPHLWPFYMVREFLSQTNELSSYSYLTDGGHFDNTGIYSLVERGCRHIVAADCGADPLPCFSDLGDAIRRCRIDFGAEIEVDITPLLKDAEGRSTAHFVVGTVTYSEQHARALKWKSIADYDRSREVNDAQQEANCAAAFNRERRGVIVLFKPSRVSDETADVRQYSIENNVFPHQTTADQWFDESQFESYRRLGKSCAQAAFGSLAEVKELGRDAGSVSLEKIGDIFERLSRKFCADVAAERRKKNSEELWMVVKTLIEKERMTRGFEYYMRRMIDEAMATIGDRDDEEQLFEEAKTNITLFSSDAVGLLTSGERSPDGGATPTPTLREEHFFEIKAVRQTLFPFFDEGSHGSGRNGHRRNGKGPNGKV
jgi:hypothetical protein